MKYKPLPPGEIDCLAGKAWEEMGSERRNIANARKYYARAIALGNIEAMRRLGETYFCMKRFPSNKLAVRLFRKAAKKNDKHSFFNLGLAYDHGKGVKPSLVKAMRWYQKAARLGVCEAQNNLAICILISKTPKPWLALKWFTKAAMIGDRKAIRNLKLFHKKFSRKTHV